MTTNVLILCTHNSTRSVLAEGMLNHWASKLGKDVRAYSAGSFPKGEVHPMALELLASMSILATGARSKSWNEFAEPGAPKMDFVLTVCDQAAGEACPVWPGTPITAHWGIPDPAAVEGTEAVRRLAFADAYRQLNNRISIFTSLPIQSLDRLSLQKRLNEIGRKMPESA